MRQRLSDDAIYHAGIIVGNELMGITILQATKHGVYSQVAPSEQSAVATAGGFAALRLFERPYRDDLDRQMIASIVGDNRVEEIIDRSYQMLTARRDRVLSLAERLEREPFLPEYGDPQGLVQNWQPVQPGDIYSQERATSEGGSNIYNEPALQVHSNQPPVNKEPTFDQTLQAVPGWVLVLAVIAMIAVLVAVSGGSV